MLRHGTAEGLVLRAARRLIAYEVRVSAAEAGRAYSLVGVDHDVMLSGLGHGVEIVIDHPLAVVTFAKRLDITHIARLDGIVAVLVHQAVSRFHVTLVVAHAGRSLVMHHELDALGVRIGIQGVDVEIRIRGQEIEHIVLVAVCPLFPAYVPTLDQQRVESVRRGEIDVLAHIGVVGGMAAVRRGGGVVEAVKLDRRRLRVVPTARAGNHLPPYSHILHRMDPADIVESAGFIQVKDHAALELLHGSLGDLDGAPGRHAGRLQTTLPAFGIGRQERAEVLALGQQVHAGIIDQRSFMDVDVEPLRGLHLQRSLHSARAVERRA